MTGWMAFVIACGGDGPTGKGHARDDTAADDTAGTGPSKMDLWSGGTRLRGADIYQQDESRADGGGTFGPRMVEQDLIDLRSAGANLIDFSVPGIFHVQHGYVVWPEARDHLDDMVDWAEAADLFVVISFRTGPGRGEGDITDDGLMDRTLFTDAEQQSAFIAMWEETAARYADRSDVVGYDLLVEPHDVNRAAWRDLVQRTVDAIRAADPDTPILVSADSWNDVAALDGWEPPSGEAIVQTVHQYEPYSYTHGNDGTYTTEELASLYRAMRAWADAHPEVALAVNEFGVKVDRPACDAFMTDELARLETLGAGHAVWLWEVAHPSGTPDFDVKENPELLAALEADWALNTLWPSVR